MKFDTGEEDFKKWSIDPPPDYPHMLLIGILVIVFFFGIILLIIT